MFACVCTHASISRWDAGGVETKTVLRVPWRALTDPGEVTFAYAKNLYNKEETAAEQMWEERYVASCADKRWM